MALAQIVPFRGKGSTDVIPLKLFSTIDLSRVDCSRSIRNLNNWHCPIESRTDWVDPKAKPNSQIVRIDIERSKLPTWKEG